MKLNNQEHFQLVQFTTDVYNYLKELINPYYKTQLIIDNDIETGCYADAELIGGCLYHNHIYLYLNAIIQSAIKYKCDEYFIKYNIIESLAHELHHSIQNFCYHSYLEDNDYCMIVEDTCNKKTYEFLSNPNIMTYICNRYNLNQNKFKTYIDTFLKNDTKHNFASLLENTNEYFISILYEIIESCMVYLDYIDSFKDNTNTDLIINEIMNFKNIYIECNRIRYTIKENDAFNNNPQTLDDLNKLEEYFALLHYNNYKTCINDIKMEFKHKDNSSICINIECDYKELPIRRFVLDRVIR